MSFRALKLTRTTRTVSSALGLSSPFSTTSCGPHVNKLDTNLSLFQHDLNPDSRPMVLLLAWLFAKQSHLHKYTQLYMQQGFDVLTVRIQLGQVMWPRRAQKVMSSVLETLEDPQFRTKPLLVHGFSVGAYLFGEMLVRMIDNPDLYSSVPGRVRGQLFDSSADHYGLPKGFSKAMVGESVLQKPIQSVLELYMKSLPFITKHYIRASDIYHANDLQIPGRFLYSIADPVVDPELLETIAAKWRQKSIPADTEVWQDAQHVSLFRKHPSKYEDCVRDFIIKCGLSEKDRRKDVDVNEEDSQKLQVSSAN